MIAEAVRTVLTAVDEQGRTDYPDWQDQVQTSITSLEASYRELRNVGRDLIDYSELPTQAAYLYRYVIGHAEFVYEILTRARAAMGVPLFSAGNLWVTSIGGGPGSDILGLIKYLKNNNDELVKGISYTVVDKEQNWNHIIDLFCEHFEDEFDINLIFQTCDLSGNNLPESVTLKDEALVIMSFFISEVCAIPESRKVVSNVTGLLKTMKNDAILLYNDSSAYSFHSFFDERVSSANNFHEIIEIREDIRANSPGYDGIFEIYHEEFGYGFKLSGNAVAKTLRRVVP